MSGLADCMTTTNTLTALVTGSTSGIGAATARALADNGFQVIITGRDVQRGQAVIDDVERRGGRAIWAPSDLAGPSEDIRRFAREATAAAGGHIDVLVHNAAVCVPADTPSLTDDELNQTLSVNVRAPHVLTATLAPAMAERGNGSIVVIGSWMATVGHAFVGLYAASKAAEAQLARSWAMEFGPRGVRVNTVAPGATRTPINEATDEAVVRMTADTPAGRPGTPDDIANAVAWLVSDAALYVHGAVIPVDGGITTTRPA